MSAFVLILVLDFFLASILWEDAKPVAIFNLALPFMFIAYFAVFE